MRFVAVGAIWRRVKMWLRPTLCMELSSFKPEGRSWTNLERMDFWNLPDEDDDDWDEDVPGGWLDMRFLSGGATKTEQASGVSSSIWRVAAREGRWFTVEIAGFSDGGAIFDELEELPVMVLPDGTELRTEPDEDFWRKNAELYLMETVPFGTVTVRVPRNVRDVEAYAIGRSRELLSTGKPECVRVTDFSKRKKPGKSLNEDIYVELHFNGYYED